MNIKKIIFQHDKTSKFFMCWFTYGDLIITVSHGDSPIWSSECPVVCICVQHMFWLVYESFGTKQQLHYEVRQMKEENWKHSKWLVPRTWRHKAHHRHLCLAHTSHIRSKKLHITLIYSTSHCAQTFVFKCVQMAAASTNQAGRQWCQEDVWGQTVNKNIWGQTVNKIDNDKSTAIALVTQTRHLPWAHTAERCRKNI